MPFEAGKPRPEGAGRAKGTKNKNPTALVRKFLMDRIVEYVTDPDGKGVATWESDMAMLRPVDRVTIMEKYMKYCMPTLSAVNIENDSENPLTIKVVYESAAPVSDDDDESNERDYSVTLPGMDGEPTNNDPDDFDEDDDIND